MSRNKRCQSCGMPLKRDPKKGGSEADGSRSVTYCSYCYQDGAFMQPDCTADDMQQFVKGVLKEKGFPGFLAGWFTRDIPRLERWKEVRS